MTTSQTPSFRVLNNLIFPGLREILENENYSATTRKVPAKLE